MPVEVVENESTPAAMLVKSGNALPLQTYHVGMRRGWFAASAALATSANVWAHRSATPKTTAYGR